MRIPNLEGPGRYQTSIQISEGARDALCEMSARLGISRTDVIEMSVRSLADIVLPPDQIEEARRPRPAARPDTL